MPQSRRPSFYACQHIVKQLSQIAFYSTEVVRTQPLQYTVYYESAASLLTAQARVSTVHFSTAIIPDFFTGCYRSPNLSSSFTKLPKVAPALFHSWHHSSFSFVLTLSFFPPLSAQISSTLFQSALHAELDKTIAQRGLFSSQHVHVVVGVHGEAVFPSSPTLSDVFTFGKTFFSRGLHNHSPSNGKKSDQVIFGSPKAQGQCDILFCPYHSNTRDDVPETLSDIFTGGFYKQDSYARRAMSFSASFKPATSVGLHYRTVTSVESSAKDIVEVAMDDDVTEKAVGVLSTRRPSDAEKLDLTFFRSTKSRARSSLFCRRVIMAC